MHQASPPMHLSLSDAVLGTGLLAVAETVGVAMAAQHDLAGPWEIRDAILRLLPLTWLVLLPPALAGAAVGVLAARGRVGRWMATFMATVFGAAVGWGVSHGRHFAAFAVRAGFVAFLAGAAAVVVWLAVPRLVSARQRWPRGWGFAALGLALGLEIANGAVLPRLYPAFHLGLAVLTATLAAPLALLVRTAVVSACEAHWRGIAALLGVAGLALASRPSARRLALADNIRRIYLERGPLSSFGVRLCTKLVPPPPLEPTPSSDSPIAPTDGPRLDWRGRDVVLLTIDALRADHVGAYGYARSTTPHIDELARTGTVFEYAYCPTPHTSYSVVSLMTGKNMRPLLLLGLGADSDTWGGLLRRYGYRTAAFYPPAVFFIDADLFTGFRDNQLEFEYARVEFSSPPERAQAVQTYLSRASAKRRIFLWVHLFEPHEPYVAHPDHPFGDRDVDRYDSEIAYADAGIGAIVKQVREVRPGAVVLIAADHGEEFGDHGGHYHGTSVYEEQVRVPLIVQAPGLVPVRRVGAPVQTIDLLPTVLEALDIPRPARVRGNSLTQWLSSAEPPPTNHPTAAGIAFSETDEQTLLARGDARLLCMRQVNACALYDIRSDPGERHDLSSSEPDRLRTMKSELAALEGSHGRFESAGLAAEGGAWPPALRRALAGDGDAAPDVAALLEDAEVRLRRKAAEVLFDLKRPEAAPALKVALSREENEDVRRWVALALARVGEGPEGAVALLADNEPSIRHAAALASAEQGDPRGASILLSWWESGGVPFERTREIVAALGECRAKEALPALVRALADIRLGVHAARALGQIGHPGTRTALLEQLGRERYLPARRALVEALVQLGARREMVPALVRWLGTPDPLPSGLALAIQAGLLAETGGPTEADRARIGQLPATVGRPSETAKTRVRVHVPAGGNGAGCRVLVRAVALDGSNPGHVLLSDAAVESEPKGPEEVVASAQGGGVDAGGHPNGGAGSRPNAGGGQAALVFLTVAPGAVRELSAVWPSSRCAAGRSVDVWIAGQPNTRIEGLAIVPQADELPPPPPEPWHPVWSTDPDGGLDTGSEEPD